MPVCRCRFAAVNVAGSVSPSETWVCIFHFYLLMSTYRLEKLFAPRWIALVGASPRESLVGRAFATRIVRFLIGEMRDADKHVLDVADLDQLVELDLKCGVVPVLRNSGSGRP